MSVYPITTEFRNAVQGAGLSNHPLAEKFVEIIGEYEHGSADVADLIEQEPINLKQYAAVALDLLLSTM